MPSAFSAEERSRITEQLLDTATRLFSTQGLRKTSLEELTAPAGIAKSSLYTFFACCTPNTWAPRSTRPRWTA